MRPPLTYHISGLNRIHLNTEKWRVCEAWFSPAIAGVDAAGLSEVIHTVLSGFDYQQKARLAQVSKAISQF